VSRRGGRPFGRSAPPERAAASADARDVELVSDDAALAKVARRCMGAARIAVDAEADGLFVYRARLCTVQLAFFEGGELRVVIVDSLATRTTILGDVLGEHGPVKVLHDVTFDAKLFAETGAPLARVRDTSVAARFVGEKQTGLAALLGDAFGVHVDKRYQQHDWGARPIAAAELAYLAGDVRHLLDLDARLAERARALDLDLEIADECAFKLASATLPPRDRGPAYARIRGASGLAPVALAVLRRLVAAREEVAERVDVPPFKVIGNDTLLELAERRPREARALAEVHGASVGRAARFTDAWLGAIARGVEDGDVPEAERTRARGGGERSSRESRAVEAKRKRCEGILTSWRRAEAERRGVDEQAILPGHCARAIAELCTDEAARGAGLRAAIAATPGMGARRAERYADAIAALVDAADA
jgi:ribonuclease D